MMNKIRHSKFLELNPSTLAVLTIVLVMTASGASATDHKPKASGPGSQVVTHLSFSGLSAVDMTMLKKVNDKYCLYVQHSRDQGISIIDITKPAQPKAVGLIPWPGPAVPGRIDLAGDVAIIAESEIFPMSGSTSNQGPRTLGFVESILAASTAEVLRSGKWLQDERNFIYVLNGDGFWVISEPGSPAATS